VQTGIARCGKLFASEHYGVEPDIITMAKGLGGGFPVAAVVGKAQIMDAADVGGLGSTYAGNPMAVAGALAVLDVVEEEQLCAARWRSANACAALHRHDGKFSSDRRGARTGGDDGGRVLPQWRPAAAGGGHRHALKNEAARRGLLLLLCGRTAMSCG
jgi:4-aminobutyrate aminotransferase-like enzyme